MKNYIHARLGREESRILKKLKSYRKQSDSALIRQALHTLYQKEIFEKRSALNLVEKSVGRFSAASDLSSNKKHMEGFGK